MPVDDLFSRPDVFPGARKVSSERRPDKAAPYTDYKPVPGRPNWYDDGFGHLKFDGMPDAYSHAAAEYKRMADSVVEAAESPEGFAGICYDNGKAVVERPAERDSFQRFLDVVGKEWRGRGDPETVTKLELVTDISKVFGKASCNDIADALAYFDEAGQRRHRESKIITMKVFVEAPPSAPAPVWMCHSVKRTLTNTADGEAVQAIFAKAGSYGRRRLLMATNLDDLLTQILHSEEGHESAAVIRELYERAKPRASLGYGFAHGARLHQRVPPRNYER